MQKKQLKKELLVRLTPEEKSELADRITGKIDLKDRLEDAKKVTVKNYSAKIEECVAEINELSSKIRGGSELRMVDCEIVYDDPQAGLKTTYRLDSNEAISTNRMDADDLQGDLFEDQPVAPAEDENGITHINLTDGSETQVTDGKRYEINGKIYRGVKVNDDGDCGGCAFDNPNCDECSSLHCDDAILVAEPEAEAESDADADPETEAEVEAEAEAEPEPEVKEPDSEDQPPYAKRGRKPAKKVEEK